MKFITGKACPDGMALIYGKCVNVVKNTASNTVHNKNCQWKSDSSAYRVASMANLEVKMYNFYKSNCLKKYIADQNNILKA